VLIGRIAQFWSPASYQTRLRNFWSEGCYPSRNVQFLGGAAQPTARPSPGDQPVRGMHQVMIDMLSLCKKNTEACVLDEARQGVVKGC